MASLSCSPFQGSSHRVMTTNRRPRRGNRVLWRRSREPFIEPGFLFVNYGPHLSTCGAPWNRCTMHCGMDPETERLVNLVKGSLRILGISNRELARRLEMSPSYVSKLLSGASELRLDHLVRICKATGLDPGEFFA